MGENVNFGGNEELLRSRGVTVVVADDAACKELMATFIRNHPTLWHEDIAMDDE